MHVKFANVFTKGLLQGSEKAYLLDFAKKSQTLQNRLRERPQFPKLQETILLILINEIFKFRPHLGPAFVK